MLYAGKLLVAEVGGIRGLIDTIQGCFKVDYYYCCCYCHYYYHYYHHYYH